MKEYNKPRLIISTCGISLAINTLCENKNNYPKYFSVYKYENNKQVSNENLKKLLKDCVKELKEANINKQRQLSTELNSLWCFYKNQPKKYKQDIHFLIHEDTWLGEKVAKVTQEAMESYNLNVSTQKIKDFRTNSLESLHNNTDEFITLLGKMLKGSKDHYEVIFNFSGNFKLMQGVMQNLAYIYADKEIYVPKKSNKVLSIPNLPITLDWKNIFLSLVNLRRLKMGLSIDDSFPTLPNIFLYQLENQFDLSEWGELIMECSKKEFYPKELLLSPSKRIIYGKKFKQSVEQYEAARIKLVNERIDELARLLEAGKSINKLGLRLLKGRGYPGSTHEINVYAKRIFCHYNRNILILDMLDEALH